MKALRINAVDDLCLCEMPKPQMTDGEALIKVKYIGVCGTDIHVLRGNHPTAVYPLIPGHEYVGELVEIKGKGSERFSLGDIVVAQELVTCGHCEPCAKGVDNVCTSLQIIGVHTHGGFAEYVKVPTRKMYRYDAGIDLQLASLTEPLAVAVHDVRRSGLKVGETAFVLGGGPIGLLVAMVARQAGARTVVLAEINDHRRSVAEQMGFTVVNPLDKDYEQQLEELSEGRGFDVSFEAAGAKNALNTCIDHTKNTGTVVVIAISDAPYAINSGKIFAKELTLAGVRVHNQYNFIGAMDIIKSGVLNDDLMKLVSKVFPLSEAVEAFAYAESNKESFKTLVKVAD